MSSNKEEILAPLLSALKDLTDWFKNTHVRGIVIGGVATYPFRYPLLKTLL